MNALFVAWRPANPSDGWRPVGRLEHDDGIYRFFYTQGAKKAEFRPFTQMEDLEQVYESQHLFPVFANRLLSKSRPEYEDFLRWGGFDAATPPDPIVILGVSEGLRKTDALEVFPCPKPDTDGCYLNKFFLHGIRWFHQSTIQRIDKLQEYEPLKLMLDLQNDYDQYAVAVRTVDDRAVIGYLPRYLAQDVWKLINGCSVIQISVERVNPEAPLQNRVLCRMNACWPEGFDPCSGEDFIAIPFNAMRPCVG